MAWCGWLRFAAHGPLDPRESHLYVRGCAVRAAKIPFIRQLYWAESPYRHPKHSSQLSAVGHAGRGIRRNTSRMSGW
jgi:hypothetical protein